MSGPSAKAVGAVIRCHYPGVTRVILQQREKSGELLNGLVGATGIEPVTPAV
jgi:hypothetical protein